MNKIVGGGKMPSAYNGNEWPFTEAPYRDSRPKKLDYK
jgi:hypothetical protein